MIFIALIGIFLFAILSYFKENTILSLPFIFHSFWFMIVFLSMFHFFGLFEISNKTYSIVLLGNLFFYFGTLTSNIKLFCRNKLHIQTLNFKYRKNLMYILLFFAILIMLKKIMLLLPIILTSGITSARTEMILNESLNLSGFLLTLQVYFAKPFIRCVSIILMVDLFQNKINIKNIIKVLLITMLSFLSYGGRSVMIQLFISLCILLFYYRKKISKKNKKKIMYSILIIGILTSLLTIERGVNLLENFYTYYAGSLVFFSKSLDMNYLFNSTFLYGVNGFQGIFRPIFGILNIFGIQDFSLLSKANSFLMDCQNTVFYVSPNIKMNYFITCFGYMYKDFGILGLIVESFIFGAIMSRFKIEKGNIYKISCFILFAQGILFSMSIIPFASYNFIMTFVYIYIITYNFKKKLRIKT